MYVYIAYIVTVPSQLHTTVLHQKVQNVFFQNVMLLLFMPVPPYEWEDADPTNLITSLVKKYYLTWLNQKKKKVSCPFMI